MVSGGKNVLTSTSTSSRSRTARAYSARLARWNGRNPGLGLSAAARSIRSSSVRASPSSASPSGRFAPAGGIMPARSFRIIFSAISTCAVALAASNEASVSPPALARSLWQPTQYLLHHRGLLGGGRASGMRGHEWRCGALRRRSPASRLSRRRCGRCPRRGSHCRRRRCLRRLPGGKGQTDTEHDRANGGGNDCLHCQKTFNSKQVLAASGGASLVSTRRICCCSWRPA